MEFVRGQPPILGANCLLALWPSPAFGRTGPVSDGSADSSCGTKPQKHRGAPIGAPLPCFSLLTRRLLGLLLGLRVALGVGRGVRRSSAVGGLFLVALLVALLRALLALVAIVSSGGGRSLVGSVGKRRESERGN